MESKDKRKILVIGGSGFLGNAVAKKLVNLSYCVSIFDQVPPPNNQIEFIQGDILDQSRLIEVIKNFDIVYNFAGYANVDKSIEMPYQFLETNILGNINILEAIRSHGNIERYVYASSAYALSDKGSFYGISKKSSELIIDEYHKQYGVNFTILRYGSVYGENADESNRIYRILSRIINNQFLELEGDGSEIREYINVDDAAQLSIKILDIQGLNQIYILTGIEKYTYLDLIKLIEEVIGKKINYKFRLSNYDGRYKYTPYKFTPNLGKKLILNPSIDFAQGILKCIEEIYNKCNVNDENN